MVAFVDVGQMCRLLRSRGIAPLVRALATYLEQDYARWHSFHLTPRVATHSAVGVVELMPIGDETSYGFKYVNGHPGNPARGLQTVTAFGALADTATGYPVLLAEMTVLTALRTAATSAWVASKLARPDSQSMALVGAGAQAEFQALAFEALLGIRQLRVFDVDPAASAKLRRNLAGSPIRVEVVGSVAAAVADADIVTTCTADKARAQILPSHLVGPGVHVNAIGGDCPGKTELDPRLLERSQVFVEYAPQTRIEGDIQQLAQDFPVTELWELIAGHHPGRSDAASVTVFDSVGFALEDFSALRLVRDEIVGTNLFTDIDLIADPADPKDLFSLLGVDVNAAAAAR